jgi:hypothetical protein
LADETLKAQTNPKRECIWMLIGILGCGLTLWLILTNPFAVPARSISFLIKPSMNGNGLGKTISITVSNCSDCPIQYDGGADTPWYRIAYVSNNVLCDTFIRTVDAGHNKLPPYAVKQSELEIPKGATTLRVGLSFTSLSWRGRLGWSMIRHSFGPLCDPIIGFLVGQDVKKRSKTEWSGEYLCQTNPTVIHSHLTDANP